MQERRLAARYSYERPVELSSPQGRRFVAEARDLSAAGIGMALSHAAVVGLAQGGALLTPGDAVQVEIPWPAGQHASPGRLILACKVSHVRRLSQDRFIVAARFVNPLRVQQEALAALVTDLGNCAWR